MPIKKVVNNNKKTKATVKPKAKISNLSKKVAKYGRKKILVVLMFASVVILAGMLIIPSVSKLAFVGGSDDAAVLGSSTPEMPKNFKFVAYNQKTITVSFETGLFYGRAKYFHISYKCVLGSGAVCALLSRQYPNDVGTFLWVSDMKKSSFTLSDGTTYNRSRKGLFTYLHTVKLQARSIVQSTKYDLSIYAVSEDYKFSEKSYLYSVSTSK